MAGAASGERTPPSTSTEEGIFADVIVPAPTGYEISTSADAPNGPITSGQIDTATATSDFAHRYGYEGGFSKTYDAIRTSESLEISVLEFTSPELARASLSFVSAGFEGGVTLPRQRRYPLIKGAIELDPTRATVDGSYEYVVAAPKSFRVMILWYSTPHPSGVTTQIADLAKTQIDRL
jgi:hypothetical protein